MDCPALRGVHGAGTQQRWEGPGKLVAISFGKEMMTDKLANHNRQNLHLPNTNRQTPLGRPMASDWRLDLPLCGGCRVGMNLEENGGRTPQG